MRILVTGGLGFLGSHLCRLLIDVEDIEIYIVDDLSNPSKILSNRVLYFAKNKKIEIFKLSVQSDEFIEICTEIQPHRIYHLAAMNTHKQITMFPVKTLVSSVSACSNIIKVAKMFNSRVLFSSSCDVYGIECGNQPLKEDDLLCDNITRNWRIAYSESKRACETIFLSAAQRGVDVRIVRIFDTFGPGLQRGITYDTIISCLAGKPIRIYKDGNQIRSFCCGYDIVKGLVSIMEETEYNKPINMGHFDVFKIIDYVKLIRELCNSNSEIQFIDPPGEIPDVKIPDLDLITKLINWNPDPVKEKLERTIRWIRSKIKKGEIVL